MQTGENEKKSERIYTQSTCKTGALKAKKNFMSKSRQKAKKIRKSDLDNGRKKSL